MSDASSPSAGNALAPVILFAYARRGHLERTIASLLANAEAADTHLTVYCDAPRRPQDREATAAVREFVSSLSGFASVTRVYRDRNLGLARSIIDGVTQALRASDRVIVLEDDLQLSPHFLRFMNEALACYGVDSRVASIHGYWYPTGAAMPETFFLRGADCWGWGTWARAWRHFEPDGERLLERVRERGLAREIDYDGTFPHMKILRRQIAGRIDSWAIRWHISCYLEGMLTLYPGRTLVENVGHDSSGTHCTTTEAYAGEPASRRVHVERIPLQPSTEARAALVDFFRGTKEPLARKVWQRLRRSWQLAVRGRRAMSSR